MTCGFTIWRQAILARQKVNRANRQDATACGNSNFAIPFTMVNVDQMLPDQRIEVDNGESD